MTSEERATQALHHKMFDGYNCCQAVAAALADQTPLDLITLHRLASGFAVGMGTTEATCGALIGAGMVLGLHQGNGSVRYTKQLLENFQHRCGATICKDLKGLSENGVFCACDDCVRNAVLAYCDVMHLK